MCCRRRLKKQQPHNKTKQNKIKQMNCTSTAKGCSLVPRESVAENKLATDAKTKTPPLGNLMIHKIKKRLRHQRLLIIYRSHQVAIILFVCRSHWWVTLLGDVRPESSATNISLRWKSLCHCVRREWLQANTAVVFINFCLYCSAAVQSRPVCLFKNAGPARRAF